eukprot:Phypoly_transcript_19659.p2 GENE.Phypoly_transcript_19659~~Phypoly_transcript_19659.p2  ORF type:complete len:143 (+),score=15.75 Phypoly_transcript_19659:201-629(+)
MGREIQILVANYGGKDVTQEARKQHKHNAQFVASNHAFGDPLPGQLKFLHVIYSYNGVLGSVAIPENHAFHPQAPHHHVLGALYGKADVTHKVQSLGHSFQVENKHFGDPNPGTIKTFTCAYVKDGHLKTIVAKEHEHVHLN